MRWRSCFELPSCEGVLLVTFSVLIATVSAVSDSSSFMDKQLRMPNYRMVYGLGDIPALRNLTKAENAEVQEKCGLVNHNKVPIKMANAPFAEMGEWPWLASLHVDFGIGADLSFCTGSIVSPWHVITASHCVQSNPEYLYASRDFPNTYIKAGGVCAGYLSNDTVLGCHGINMTQTRKVNKILFSSHYVRHFLSNSRVNDDIAIYEVSEPFEFNDLVRPLCVGHLNLTKLYGAIQAGFGSDINNATGVLNFHHSASIVMDPSKAMFLSYSAYLNFPQPGNELGGIGTCGGDSGGPTLVRSAGSPRYFLMGDLTGGGPEFGSSDTRCGTVFVVHDKGPVTFAYIEFICEKTGVCREPKEVKSQGLIDFLS